MLSSDRWIGNTTLQNDLALYSISSNPNSLSPRAETTTLELQSPEDTSKTRNLKTYLICFLDWRIAYSMSKMQTKSDMKESQMPNIQ
uniref:Putative ovule protein n=1 Tax=Solanum chacoense TaxID=4108 RepID=A0A0V0H028_SOLCH